MNRTVFPTKTNLLTARRSLKLSKLGYELLDKKRNILISEMMLYMDKAKKIQSEIDIAFSKAYIALQRANFTLGVIDNIAKGVKTDNSLKLYTRSVMGVELPIITLDDSSNDLPYGMIQANSALDQAFIAFTNVKKMCVKLAETQSCIYRLANAIKTTQKRANALENIVIPQYQQTIKFITDYLEEKEREEFTKQKLIKKHKAKK